MAEFGSSWSTYADLALAEATVEAAAATDVFGPSINGAGTTGSMGHFCYFEMDGNTNDDYTKPFDFPVNGDLTIVINPTKVNTDAATTLDVSMQGSVDGVNYVELQTRRLYCKIQTELLIPQYIVLFMIMMQKVECLI